MSVRDYLFSSVRSELERASAEHDAFHSAHEGYAVILEELDELWDEIKKRSGARSKERMMAECVQIAAMAVRFAKDICVERCSRPDDDVG